MKGREPDAVAEEGILRDRGRQVSLRLKDLWKRHGSTAVLRGVSAELSGVAVVRGANGSGKSTLLAVVAGAVRPDRGSVELGTRHGPNEEAGPAVAPAVAPAEGPAVGPAVGPSDSVSLVRGQVGWLAHDGLLYGDLSGRANVELAARLGGVGVEWGALCERFGLGAFAERPVRTLSRGQAQRVALARAMVGCPRVLLLDEPTTGLDQEGVALLRGLVAQEAARGAVVVVVTHEASVVWGEAGGGWNASGGDAREVAVTSSWNLSAGRLARVR